MRRESHMKTRRTTARIVPLVLILLVAALYLGLQTAGAATTVTLYSTGFEGASVNDAASGWQSVNESTRTSVMWGEKDSAAYAYSGTKSLWCAGKNNSSATQYANYMKAWVSRDVTLTSDYTSAWVSFYYRLPSIDVGGGDIATLEVSEDGGNNWVAQSNYFTPAASWTQRTLSNYLDAYIPAAGQDPKVIKLRWRWASDNDGVGAGIFIDEFKVQATYDPAGGDSTPPSEPAVTADATVTTDLTRLGASWSAEDPESAISAFRVSVGTSPGASDTVSWMPELDGSTSDTSITGLSLTPGQDYYVNVQAKNGVGMWGAVGSSEAIRAKKQSSATIARNMSAIYYWWTVNLSGLLRENGTTNGIATGDLEIQQQRVGLST
ncbi:MAG: hypothetical protein C4521_12200, partial [Actinobacteria bacterium]